MPHRIHHASDDTVATLVKSNRQQRTRLTTREQLDPVRLDGTVIESQALLQALDGPLIHDTSDLRHIGLRNLEAGVGEAMGELAVVGQEDQALGVGVKASDVEEPFRFAR